MTNGLRSNNTNQKINNLLENDFIDLNNSVKGIFRRKKYFFTFSSLTFAICILVTFYNRIFNPVYLGSFTLLINDPLSIQQTKAYRPNEEEIIEKVAKNDTDVDIPTLIEYLKSPSLIGQLTKKYNYKISFLRNNIKVKTGGKLSNKEGDKAEGILKVSFQTKNPKQDIKLLEDLSLVYLQTSLKQRQQRLKDGLDFLDSQEPILKEKYNNLQSKLVDFREKYSLIEPEGEGISLKIQEQKLKEDLSLLKSEKNRLLIVREEVKNGTISATGFEEQISSNNFNGLKIKDFDQSLLKQIFSLENEISKKRTIFKEDSETIKNLKNNLSELNPLLQNSQLKAVDTAIRLNSAKISDAEDNLKELQNNFLRKPSLIKKFNALQQNLNISEKNLIGLVSARENFQLQIAQSSVPWKIIEDPYILKNPIKPSIQNGFLVALLSGTFVGLLSAFLRDKVDNVFHEPIEVEELLDCEILASIPNMKVFEDIKDANENIFITLDFEKLDINKKEKIFLNKQKFQFQESLKNLYSSIKFIPKKKKTSILSITSCLSAEGKSIINIMLSKTLAELGLKVLLIDGDLRKPRIHLRTGLDNKVGLSDYLSEKNLDLKKIIKNLDGVDNLDIITSGSKLKEPSKLLSSSKMKLFLNDISNSDYYDFVLIDSPQILGISDSFLNSEFIDGYILLVSLGKISRNLPGIAIKRIRRSNTPLLGVITNQLNRSTFGKKDKLSYNYEYLSSDYYFDESKLDNKKINNSQENILNGVNEDITNKNKINFYLDKFMSKLKSKFKLIKLWIDQ